MKGKWLMIRTNGTLWITAGRYTFDEAMSKSWIKSTPIFMLKPAQVADYRMVVEIRKIGQ